MEEGETGAEREKRLRKLAQRGVVRLFNAIGAAQGVTGKDKEIEEQEARKKAAVKLNAGEIESGGTVNRRPNVLGGRGKGEARQSLLVLCTSMLIITANPKIEHSYESFEGVFPRPHSSWNNSWPCYSSSQVIGLTFALQTLCRSSRVLVVEDQLTSLPLWQVAIVP